MKMKQESKGKNLVSILWKSYLLVLIIPIVIIGISAFYSFSKLNHDVKQSNISKLEHSVELIEKNLLTLNIMAQQSVGSKTIQSIAALDEVEVSTILQYKDGMDELSTILKYQKQGIGFIDKFFLYLNQVDYCIYEGSFYKFQLFEQYLDKWKISKEEWQEKIVNKDITKFRFVRTESGKLLFLFPVNCKVGQNNGMLVFLLDEEAILKYFSFPQEYGEVAFYATDVDGNIMFSKDAKVDRQVDFSKSEVKEIFPEVSPKKVLVCHEPDDRWWYYVILPETTIGDELWKFWLLEASLMCIAIVVSVVLSRQQANKMGKPMQKAFFHDLITLDVSSGKELQYLAESVGISLKLDKFWIASVRLFSNNDAYDIDGQTIEDVRVIILAMQNYMEEQTQGKIWFFQRNYLSLLVLIEAENKEQILNLMKRTYQWLREEHSTESMWGLSSQCKDMVHTWKYAEEADLARSYCDTECYIMEYSTKFNDRQTMYFPELAQEKFLHYLKAGDAEGIKDILDILQKENVANRVLNRNGFIKLNTKVCELLSELEYSNIHVMHHIMTLNQTIVENKENFGREYFATLSNVCEELCKSQSKIKGAQRNLLIENIKDYIEINYANPDLGLAMVSVTFGVSEGYVSTLFKEQTQVGFAEYIEKQRIEKAVELLKGDGTVEEIAASVGYNSVQSFRRAFKRVLGASPKNYRQ